MQFLKDTDDSDFIIQSYSKEGVVINGVCYQDNLLLTKSEVICPWNSKTVQELTPDDLKPLIQDNEVVIILGTGDKCLVPSEDIREFCYGQDIKLEFMDTGAACRTYTILSNEGRSVVALLFQDKSS